MILADLLRSALWTVLVDKLIRQYNAVLIKYEQQAAFLNQNVQTHNSLWNNFRQIIDKKIIPKIIPDLIKRHFGFTFPDQ